jgi:uncharacterized protein
MKCPNCDRELQMTTREGVEIDYCPQCRGIWLDRGELDKIVASSAVANLDVDTDDDRRDAPMRSRGSDSRHPRKRESFLSRLFDFD